MKTVSTDLAEQKLVSPPLVESTPTEALPASYHVERPKSNFGEVYPYSTNLSWSELAWGIAALMLWLVIFAAGLLVPSRNAMEIFWTGKLPSLGDSIYYGFLSIISYPGTNIVFLSCSAAVLGCIARRWQVSDELKTVTGDTTLAPPARVYIAAILRGFFLYLMIVAGALIVLPEDALTNTQINTFAQYWRIAGWVSVMAFVMGYNPNLLVRLIQQIVEAMPKAEQTATSIEKSGQSDSALQTGENVMRANGEGSHRGKQRPR